MISLSTYRENPAIRLSKMRGGLVGNEPVTLAEAKSYLRVTSDADDQMILLLVKAARESLEVETNQSYVDSVIISTWKNVVGGFNFPDPASSKTLLEAKVSFGSKYEIIPDDRRFISDNRFTFLGNKIPAKVQVKYSESVVVSDLAKLLIMRLVRWHYDNKGESVGGTPDWLQKEASKLNARLWF